MNICTEPRPQPNTLARFITPVKNNFNRSAFGLTTQAYYLANHLLSAKENELPAPIPEVCNKPALPDDLAYYMAMAG